MTTVNPAITRSSRGFLVGFSEEELRRKIATPPYDKLWARLRTRAAEQIAAV